MNLNFVSKIRISFCPLWGTPAVREFINRVTTKKAKASNPKCVVEVNQLDANGLNEVKSFIDLDFSDGSKQVIEPGEGMLVQEIMQTILLKTEQLEVDQEFAEMKANPVTGPMPMTWWKKGKFTYVKYAATDEKSKRAAGGVKTIKKK